MSGFDMYWLIAHVWAAAALASDKPSLWAGVVMSIIIAFALGEFERRKP